MKKGTLIQTCHRWGSEGKAPTAGSCGGPGADPPAAGRFFVSFWIKPILIPLDHISNEFRAI